MSLRNHLMGAAIVSTLLCLAIPQPSQAGFGGQPLLKSDDGLRRLLEPYDLVELNYLGANYCENLFDMRQNTLSYTHMGYDSNSSDAWHLMYPDDMGRFMEATAWEADFSPVARLELMRRMTKGLISAHVPGTQGYYFFRHRDGAKVFLILDDELSAKDGRVTLSNFGDFNQGLLRIGFRAEKGGKWSEIEQFSRTDEPANAGNPGLARSVENWNKSPYVFTRHYKADDVSADFVGRYWMSDDDMPLEYRFTSSDADRVQTVIGEPSNPMQLMVSPAIPGIVHLPDGKTFSSDVDGDKVIERPDFNYLILRKKLCWIGPGYSSALLVMWDGKPEKLEFVKDNGYGQIRASYARQDGVAGGKVWVYPFQFANERDMKYIGRNAETFLATGKLMHNTFPTLESTNAAAAGLAAGAYMLTKYNDPLAVTARVRAAGAVDEIFESTRYGMYMSRAFFPARAAAWMVKTAKELGDARMVAKYTGLLSQAMDRMLSDKAGYDGKGWPDGWTHFNSVKATWLAYDATGNDAYRQAWERSLTVYTIDDAGIYRYGKKMDAPGGFETYFGSLPLGVWGNAGMMDNVNKLLNLNAAAGWTSGELPTMKLFHDTGCGPWSQDDADPEYVGVCLRGAKIPQTTKYIIPVGAFPIYDATGKVEITNQPIVDNPFFMPGNDPLRIVKGDSIRLPHHVTDTRITPGSTDERAHMTAESGAVTNAVRHCSPKSSPVVYRFDTKGAMGAGVDMSLRGDFRVDVSPDGRRWYPRLDSWSSRMSAQSLDVSFLTGSRDELLKTDTIAPPDDSTYIVSQSGTTVDDTHRRYVAPGGALVYRLDLPDAVECRLEVMMGNGYKLECSSDGKTWKPGLDASQTKGGKDAAWIRMLNVTRYLRPSHTVYLRLTTQGDAADFGGKGAFLRRINVYSVFDSGAVFVRLAPTAGDGFELSSIALRSWKD